METTGIFDSPTIAAHCVCMTDNDLEILKKHNVSVVHNPISNLKLASGVAPITKMIDMGINVALGTDGASSNNSLDMFEEMKVAAVYAISELIDEKDLRADYVVPDAFDPRVAPAVAAAVARVAMETGIARIKVDPEEVRANTMKRVGR